MRINTTGKLTGGLTVEEGELQFFCSQTTQLMGTSALNVRGTGVVRGSGMLGALTAQSGSTVIPYYVDEDYAEDNAPATIKTSAVTNIQKGATLQVVIAGANSYSQLQPLMLTMNGTLNVVLDGYTPKLGDEFTLWTVTRTFSGTPTYDLPALPAGLYWDTRELNAVKGVLKVSDDASLGIGQISADAIVSCEAYTVAGVQLGTFKARRSDITAQLRKLGVLPGTYVVRMTAGRNSATETVIIR